MSAFGQVIDIRLIRTLQIFQTLGLSALRSWTRMHSRNCMSVTSTACTGTCSLSHPIEKKLLT